MLKSFYGGRILQLHVELTMKRFEPLYEKSCLRCFRPGPTQCGLYSHRGWLEALNFGFGKGRNCTIYIVETKALISCAVTVQLICVSVFAYTKSRFSPEAAHLSSRILDSQHNKPGLHGLTLKCSISNNKQFQHNVWVGN